MSLVHMDVAVIGSELSALAAGAMLAHEHKKVVVIDDAEADETPLGEHLVPRAPALWRLPTTGPAADLIEKLGLKQDARRVLGAPCGVAIVDDPDARLLIEPDTERKRAELVRAFGTVGLAAAHALDDVRPKERDGLFVEASLLHDEGFFARRRAAKRRAEHGPSLDVHSTDAALKALLASPLGPAFASFVPFVQHTADAPVDGFAGFLAAWLLHGGTVAHPSEGTSLRGALSRRFLHTIEGHGGDVVKGSRVKMVEGDARRVTVVRTDGKNDFAVRAVVDGTEGRTLTQRLPDGKGRSETVERQRAAPHVGGAAIVRMLVERRSLPRGMSSRTVVLPGEPSLRLPLLVAAYEGLPSLDGRPPKGPSRFTALVAACKWSSSETPDDIVARVERKLLALMPFAESAIVAKDAITGETAWRALPTYARGEGVHELGGVRPTTGFKNVARAGRDLAPLLGLEGEIAAAPSVATVVEEALGRKRAGGEG